MAAAGICATVVLQCWAWWTNARATATVTHAFWFLSNPAWEPPGGWSLWTAAALGGCVLLITTACLGARLQVRSVAASNR